MSEVQFVYVIPTSEMQYIPFSETVEEQPYVRVVSTIMELSKASVSGKLYKFSEADTIVKSLKQVPVYYGSVKKKLGWKHCNPMSSNKLRCKISKPIGHVEMARLKGRKIQAYIRITAKKFIKRIKEGSRFLFSVGGQAMGETIKKIGNKLIHILRGVRANHLQMVEEGVKVGFPAKIDKVIDFSETVLFVECKDCQEKPEEDDGLVIEGLEDYDFGL